MNRTKRQNDRFTGLTGIAMKGFFTKLQDEVIRCRTKVVKLRPNGRITPEYLKAWASSRGYATEDVQNGGIRIGVINK